MSKETVQKLTDLINIRYVKIRGRLQAELNKKQPNMEIIKRLQAIEEEIIVMKVNHEKVLKNME